MSFQYAGDASILVWTGEPDCQAAHDWLLEWLKNHVSTFLNSGQVNSDEPLSIRRKGNLGECIAFQIGSVHRFANTIPFPANALTPLEDRSLPEVDIVWLKFGESVDEDVAIIQEVKTTSQIDLKTADKLLPDFEKLFAPIGDTLNMRLMAIKNRLEYVHNRKDLCDRVTYLGGTSPTTATKIRLVPTLVYDGNLCPDPKAKMLTIRRTLIGKGWDADAVTSWAINFSDLEQRLVRLAMGEN